MLINRDIQDGQDDVRCSILGARCRRRLARLSLSKSRRRFLKVSGLLKASTEEDSAGGADSMDVLVAQLADEDDEEAEEDGE